MGGCFVLDPAGANGAWAVELMIKPMVTKIRKINSYLSQKFHSMFVTVRTETGFWTYIIIDFVFEILDRCRIFGITVLKFPID